MVIGFTQLENSKFGNRLAERITMSCDLLSATVSVNEIKYQLFVFIFGFNRLESTLNLSQSASLQLSRPC